MFSCNGFGTDFYLLDRIANDCRHLLHRLPEENLSVNSCEFDGNNNFIMGFQACGLGLVFSIYGRATAVNIIYTSRGFWSILMVWWLGRFLGIAESGHGWRVMVRRLAGALLLMTSIILVLLEG